MSIAISRIRELGRQLALPLLVLALAGAGLAPPAAAESYSEQEVKAAFLYHFQNFVHWPPGAFENGSSPLRYCVAGDPEMAELLKDVLLDERAGSRPFELIEDPEDPELTRCHVLFLGTVETTRVEQMLSMLDGASALTVSDHELEHGQVMIRLTRRSRRVHPLIDLDAVEQSDLQISAKLLRLATVTRDGGH